MSIDRVKKELRDQIAKEERLVRIYEAELSLLQHSSSRKRSRPTPSWSGGRQETEEFQDRATGLKEDGSSERDWLETLDALQSNVTKHANGTVKLETRWHDDPIVYRLLPLVSGVAFTSVLPHLQQIDETNNISTTTRRVYELNGKVTAPNATPIVFSVLVTIEFTPTPSAEQQGSRERARIVSVQCSFVSSSSCSNNNHKDDDSTFSPEEELDQMARVASESCNLPLFFRQLVCWAEFDAQIRTPSMQRWQQQQQQHIGGWNAVVLKRRTACKFELQIADTTEDYQKPQAATAADSTTVAIQDPRTAKQSRFSMLLSWKWNCTWFGRGQEELKILDCTVAQDVEAPGFDSWLREIRNPQGLQDLVSCVGGCEGAIDILIKTLRGDHKKRGQ